MKMNIPRGLKPRRRAAVQHVTPEVQALPHTSRLLPQQRQDSVLALVAQKRWVTVRELMSELHVSEATVRRDLDRLAGRNLIVRIHGGAQWREYR